jgi:hypothetical protein
MTSPPELPNCLRAESCYSAHFVPGFFYPSALLSGAGRVDSRHLYILVRRGREGDKGR